MNKPKPIRLKYIPTDMYAVRYFKEKPFVVPEEMSFGYSKNVDFSKLNLEFKKDGYYKYLFTECENCIIDVDKMNLNNISKESTSIFSVMKNCIIKGELPLLNDYIRYISSNSFEKLPNEYVFELAEKISRLKIISEDTKLQYMFYLFPRNSNFKALYSSSSSVVVFPYLDLTKWNVKNNGNTDINYFLYGANIFELKMFEPQTIINGKYVFNASFIFRLYWDCEFLEFPDTDYNYYQPFCCALYLKNIGKKKDTTIYSFYKIQYANPNYNNVKLQDATNGELLDEITLEESIRSMRYTLIENSFDRAAAGFSACTLRYLNSYAKNELTEEEIAQITAKGFSIA